MGTPYWWGHGPVATILTLPQVVGVVLLITYGPRPRQSLQIIQLEEVTVTWTDVDVPNVPIIPVLWGLPAVWLVVPVGLVVAVVSIA